MGEKLWFWFLCTFTSIWPTPSIVSNIIMCPWFVFCKYFSFQQRVVKKLMMKTHCKYILYIYTVYVQLHGQKNSSPFRWIYVNRYILRVKNDRSSTFLSKVWIGHPSLTFSTTLEFQSVTFFNFSPSQLPEQFEHCPRV